MPIILYVVLGLLYLVVGLILSAPYTYLAGWDFENFHATALFAPVAVFILLLAYTLRGAGRRDGKRPKWGGSFFWVLVAYFCLPIFLNGASLLLKWAGYETLGRYIFKGRYISLLTAPMLFMFLVAYSAIANGVRNLWQRFNGGATPPSSISPGKD